MNRGKAVKPLKELNLTNRFLFDEVMEDAETHRTVLSIIFGRDIPPLIHNETEKESRISPTVRSIRMDVFSMDENEVVYNTEMQTKKEDGSGKAKPLLSGVSGYVPPGTGDSGLS